MSSGNAKKWEGPGEDIIIAEFLKIRIKTISGKCQYYAQFTKK